MQCKMQLRVIVHPTNVVSLCNSPSETGWSGWGHGCRRSEIDDGEVQCVCGKLLISLPLPLQRPRFRSCSLLHNPRRTANRCVGAGWVQITREESHLSNPQWSSSLLVLSAAQRTCRSGEMSYVESEVNSVRSNISYLNNVRSQRTST